MVQAEEEANEEKEKGNITLEEEEDFFNLFFLYICYIIMEYTKETNLIRVARNGDISRVREYLDRGADPNFRDYLGNTALIYASLRGLNNIAELLLDNGANPNIRNRHGNTALMIAESRRNYDITRLIRDHIRLQKARQRLAFATYLLGNDTPMYDLDYDVTARIAEYVNDLDQYGSGKRRRKRKIYTRRRSFF